MFLLGRKKDKDKKEAKDDKAHIKDGKDEKKKEKERPKEARRGEGLSVIGAHGLRKPLPPGSAAPASLAGDAAAAAVMPPGSPRDSAQATFTTSLHLELKNGAAPTAPEPGQMSYQAAKDSLLQQMASAAPASQRLEAARPLRPKGAAVAASLTRFVPPSVGATAASAAAAATAAGPTEDGMYAAATAGKLSSAQPPPFSSSSSSFAAGGSGSSSRGGDLSSSLLSIAMSIQPPPLEPPLSPTEKSYGSVRLDLPAVRPQKPSRAREVALKRTPRGDFGFSLRRGTMAERGDAGEERQRAVVFAEPGSLGLSTGLLPGDRLVEVNGVNVEERSREEVVALIRTAGETLLLRVQPVPELSELSLRAAGMGRAAAAAAASSSDDGSGGSSSRGGGGSAAASSSSTSQGGARSEDEVAAEKGWHDSERMWLVHKGGYSACALLSRDGDGARQLEGRCRVRLEQSGDVLEVDEMDLEKRNPAEFDRAEDLTRLVHLNESSVLHSLRQRYGSSLIHTYAGPALLVFNPVQPVNLYSDKIIQMLRSCRQQDVPPHVYASAQLAYRHMLSSRRNQSIVFAGRSGGGKTTSLRHVLQYYAVAYGGSHSNALVEKLNAAMVLLEAFGNCRTVLNTNASRFAQLTSVDFDACGVIASVSLQAMFLEKTRVVRRPEGESAFHIFYYLLSGAEGLLRNELLLGNVQGEPSQFLTPLQRPDEQRKASQSFVKVEAAMKTLTMGNQEIKVILGVLAAIYHLGIAGVTKGANNKPYFMDPAAGQKAATLLGTTVEDLNRSIFTSATPANANNVLLRPSGSSPSDKQEEKITGVEALEGFVTGLYSEVFNAIVSGINRSLSSSARAVNSILLLDEPGLQNPASSPSSSSRPSGATFEDLCYNYVQERLQLVFHTTVFSNQLDRYAQENIMIELDEVDASPQPMVDILDKSSALSNLLRSTGDLSLGNDEARGLLWLLDEESLVPGASEEEFVSKLRSVNDAAGGKTLLSMDNQRPTRFTLLHQQSTVAVQYDAGGWLKANKENPASRQAAAVLLDSSRGEVCDVFSRTRLPMIAGGSSSSSGGAAADAAGGLLRSASTRRGLVNHAGIKRRSVAVQLKYQADALVETLQKTRVHFVFNLLPQAAAGLSGGTVADGGSGSTGHDEMLLSVPLVREQLRGMQILPALRHCRQGFPEHMTFTEFCQSYGILAQIHATSRETIVDHKKVVEGILAQVDVVDPSKYKIGLSQVFFRYGTLAQLSDLKEARRARFAVILQSYLRRYLAQKLLKRLKVQHAALLCIQRNVRKYVGLKDWQWWKLYVKVKPLVNVNRMEDELRTNAAVVEELHRKVDKLDKERAAYKADCERLEATVAQVRDDYTEERRASAQATELLEAEMSKRIMLEKELKEQQTHNAELEHRMQKLLAELTQSRAWEAASIQEVDEVDNDLTSSASRAAHERLRRDSELARRKLQQEHAGELEQMAALKQRLDKQLHEVLMERDELAAQVGALKRKLQRANDEQLDLRHHLDESLSRNADLEKKQRRFDADMQALADEQEESRLARDKLLKERDRLLAEKYSFSRDLETARSEVDILQGKLKRAEREMADLALTESAEGETVQLKKAKHELESRVTELEDELAELQQENDDLNNAKLRLQMDQEKTRQKHAKELEELEKDTEELKNSSTKKIRTLENKVEEFEDEIRSISAVKRDLEKQLQEALLFAPRRDEGDARRLKAELKHVKALLADAQLMAGKRGESVSQRSNVRTLQAQLEDAQSGLSAALRAKKSLELELTEAQGQLERATRQKIDAEERLARVAREKAAMESDREDADDEADELLKKLQAASTQHSADIAALASLTGELAQANEEKRRLQEENEAALSKIQHFESGFAAREKLLILEMKLRDSEQKLDFEKTARARFEAQTKKLKEQAERVSDELSTAAGRATAEERSSKQLQVQLARLTEELSDKARSAIDATQHVRQLEQTVEYLEMEKQQLQADLALAQQRLDHLTAALRSSSLTSAPDDSDDPEDDAFGSSSDDDD